VLKTYAVVLKNGKTLNPTTFNNLDCDPNEVFTAENKDKNSTKKAE